MTALEQAAQDALELSDRIIACKRLWDLNDMREVSAALRAALAQQAEPVVEPVSMDKIKHTHTAMTRFAFEHFADISNHKYAGMPHRIYTQSDTDGCYLCACLAEIDRLKQQAEPVAAQAEPVVEPHKRATDADNDRSMSGNPSY